MNEATMFHLLWKAFIQTNILSENKANTHKVLYQRADGHWALKFAEGAVYLTRPTLEELMLEVIRTKADWRVHGVTP
jgi:hypothetical protein